MALQQIANTDISSTGTFALGSVSSSALTSGRVTYATTGGLLTDSASLTYNGTILTSAAFSGALNGTVGATTPSTVVATSVTNSGLTSGRITYASTGGLLVDSANLVFTGSNLGIGATSPSYKISVKGSSATSNNILLTHDTDTTGAYSRIRFQFAEGNTSIASEIRNIQRVNGQNGASLGLYTDSTAGTLTQRMLIDYDGNVGIGTDSPSSRLDIVRSSTSTTGFAEPQMRVINTGAATLNQRVDIGMRWQDGTYNGIGGISMLRESATARSGSLMFSSIASDGNGLAAMHIKSTGKVGIGTDSPNANLQVTSDSFPVLKVADGVGGGAVALGDSTISSNYVGIWRGAANSISGGGFLNIQGNNIAFMSTDAVFGSATRTMTLDNTGNLGIGTSSQNERLRLNSSTAGQARMSISYADSTISFYGSYSGIVGSGNATDTMLSSQAVLAFGAGGTTERMRIDSAGNVGIGVSTIQSFTKLQISGTAGAQTDAKQQLYIQAPTTTVGEGAGVRFSAASGGKEAVGIIGVVNNTSGISGSMTFHVYNGGGDIPEWMRITNTGNLLIGGTSYGGEKLTLNFTGSAQRGMVINNSTTTTQDAVAFIVNNTFVGWISSTTTGTSYNTISDYRLKNITGAVTGAKDFIMALQPKQGTWKSDGSKFVGFVAHEFAEVSPTSVSRSKDEIDEKGNPVYQGIQASSSEVMANLISLVQEQQALIESMATKLKDAGVAGF